MFRRGRHRLRYDRLLSRTDPPGRTTRRTWDDAGDLVSVTGPDGTGERGRRQYWPQPSLS
ncbi:RHS repeat domain-containing protein [Streptomyces sp. NPDC017676]|uniref:RHS repeat domain-containing protein n=1 Tax=Streptomyces sp. NPDC017676 TaxID=3365006 RepID=UPI0037AA3D46